MHPSPERSENAAKLFAFDTHWATISTVNHREIAMRRLLLLIACLSLLFVVGCSANTNSSANINNCRLEDNSLAPELYRSSDGYQCQNGEWVKLKPTVAPPTRPPTPTAQDFNASAPWPCGGRGRNARSVGAKFYSREAERYLTCHSDGTWR